MNVWLLPSAFFPHVGGVEELTLQLARALRRRGDTVVVVTNRHPPTLPGNETVDSIPVRRVAFPAPRAAPRPLARFPVDFARTVRELFPVRPHPDVIHVQCPSAQLPAAVVVASLRRVPLVVTTQGEVAMDADQIYSKSTYLRTALRVTSRVADTLTACSRWAADQAATVAPAYRAASIIPNGVDPTQWTTTPAPGSATVAAWGRHVPQKGFDLLLRAWPLVRAHNADARLLLGGLGPETSQLHELATPGVEFLGPLDRVSLGALLAESRVVAVPSRIEPFGIVALEAMASGRPVVWSKHGGLADATGGLGWPVDPFDTEALARAIVDAIEARPAEAPYREHAERFAWPAIAERYRELYVRSVHRAGKRGA